MDSSKMEQQRQQGHKKIWSKVRNQLLQCSYAVLLSMLKASSYPMEEKRKAPSIPQSEDILLLKKAVLQTLRCLCLPYNSL